MTCDTCNGETRVMNSRKQADKYIRRRRECTNCGERFTTYETKEPPVTEIESMIYSTLMRLAENGKIELNL